MDESAGRGELREKLARAEDSLERLNKIIESLMERESHYRALAELCQDIVFIVGDDGRVRFVNAFAAAFLGKSPEDILGRPLEELFPPGVFEFQGLQLQRVFHTGDPLFVEDAISFLDRKMCLETRLIPVRDKDGAVCSVLGICRDITERRQLEEALKKAEESLKTAEAGLQRTQRLESLAALSGGIAHEFNNILTMIMGNIALSRLYPVTGEMKDILDEAEKASMKGSALANQMLAFSNTGDMAQKVIAVEALLKNPEFKAVVKEEEREEEKDRFTTRTKGSILLMDDEEGVRVVIGRMLEQCGYEVDLANDGDTTLGLYRAAVEAGKPYDAVILDLVVSSGPDGKETARRLMAAHPEARIIAATGNYNDPAMTRFGDYGFKDVLAKPFLVDELNLVLGKIIKQ